MDVVLQPNGEGKKPGNGSMFLFAHDSTAGGPANGSDKMPLMRTSVIIGIVMLLKTHLKALYSLSEE